MKISIIVAKAANNVIGKDNQLIWHIPADLKYFKKVTSGHCVIMGRKTHESIGKCLPNRLNIVISRNKEYQPYEGGVLSSGLEEAIEYARQKGENEVFIIGGGVLYQEAIKLADKLYITEIHDQFTGDTFFPEISCEEYTEISRFEYPKGEKSPYAYSFVNYIRN
ncbi:dihydrofolate reductase [Flammeovirga yaeyamensis]|uniref:Dihydrofolate reductase n=1 Tax=Flammeovirga yaeyamensis TaxID=367791 RepID=A0AAX1N527_9BACT|nr:MULTISPECIES: dihydrofolate reductase [Flammeovirga]ANQ50278.1 dihydrofolate reductase [Flammeovirga sp. MY04]MBB3699773.1 dihydrofolate reductase [Flammeovirga yaeyamensis]NMF36658.1 dihydrofolate reductase [Flammeovirga yaeyamensis]QWG02297.1 dihydrofolate reductase [Flammeovirga yaeyamensis]